MKKIKLLVCLALAVIFTCCNKSHSWTAESPDGSLAITVELDDDSIYYSVNKKIEGKTVLALGRSNLGIIRKDQDLSSNLSFVGSSEVTSVKENYTMLIGKQTNQESNSNELKLSFKNVNGALLDIILRVFDDGVAFRYHFPENSGDIHFITGELSSFKLDTNGRAWMMPYSRPSQFGPSYESNYLNGIPIGTSSRSDHGWAFPLLFNTRGLWVLITEADVDDTFYGARTQQDADNGLYKIRLPDPAEGLGNGIIEASSTLPWSSPWRIIMVGETPASIVENNMVYHLSEPSRISDVSWIMPGRVSWSWWSDHSSPRDADKLKKFIDLSAEMSWEYTLIDANWNIMKKGNIDQIRKYAAEKGVGLLLWYNSGGSHNTVTEQPRDIMSDPVKRREEMKKLQEWGIKGVKVDFFHSDKASMMKHYLDILKDAAEFHLLVDFHGCTLPRGWSRTWPNLMTMEGVKGAEQYTGDLNFAENASVFNTIYPYTRNAVGPMDYTPVTFSNYSSRTAHKTTFAHELALSVVFESGLQHFADRDSAYRAIPEYAKNLLKNIPVAWDQTKYLSGEPGKLIAVARRKGDTWYVAAINGENEAKKVHIPLSFLDKGNYILDLITDGLSGREFNNSQEVKTASETIELDLLARGGFTATLVKE